MRQGSSCFLLEAQPGSLAELERCLERWWITCRRDADGADPLEDILVVALDGQSAATPRLRVEAWQAAGRVVLALCRLHDFRAIALAASLAADEILTLPLDEQELRRRLEQLGDLVTLERERRLRTRLFAPYRTGRYGIRRWPSEATPLPKVCVLGEPTAGRAQIIDALPAVMISYVERPDSLLPYLAATTPDVMLVTRPDYLMAAMEATEAAETPLGAPVVLAAHHGPPALHDLPPSIDLLGLPAPAELVRTRLRRALRVAGLRRWLRHPFPADDPNLLIDSLTGLYNLGLLLDYLSVPAFEPAPALVALELSNLAEINCSAGYAAGNAALATIGRSLARKTRPDDLAAYLGRGRFVVAIPARTQTDVTRIRQHLKHRLDKGSSENFRLAAASEALPIRGSAPERVERLFRDLSRLGRAA